MLFDPLRGVPVPGPTAERPATLAEVKANPDLLKPWTTDGKERSRHPDQIKASLVFPTVPLSAVSARMATFQVGAGEELDVRAAVDVAALAKAIQACGEKLHARGIARGFVLTPLRSLREYVTVAEGARPAVAVAGRLLPRRRRPSPPPAGAELGLAERYRIAVGSTYGGVVIKTRPREKLQRGKTWTPRHCW